MFGVTDDTVRHREKQEGELQPQFATGKVIVPVQARWCTGTVSVPVRIAGAGRNAALAVYGSHQAASARRRCQRTPNRS